MLASNELCRDSCKRKNFVHASAHLRVCEERSNAIVHFQKERYLLYIYIITSQLFCLDTGPTWSFGISSIICHIEASDMRTEVRISLSKTSANGSLSVAKMPVK